MADLENTATGEQATGTDTVERAKAKGILKKLKTYRSVQCILMLSDVLPLLSELSRTFQAKVVSLAIIQEYCINDMLSKMLKNNSFD